MKRIDIVYNKLCELSPKNGIDTGTLANLLNLSRANVSSELNKLCIEGKVKKGPGRPVLYSVVRNPSENPKSTKTTMDKFIECNRSLVTAGEQARAAILYPPKGMNTLILGETGVGKSMFAGIMHKYAIEMKRMTPNAPFITFNCADYTNNPQLLLSQIFGVKKGAFTGADSDKMGLIEKANGGILFLDEVHRLPAEGQEMFFTFMDKGTFMRLGETAAERKADVFIIAATTENPDSTLLRTFTRRIPMIIKMPNISERSVDERFELITEFFREESFRLDRKIIVSVNSMRSFLSYNCPNNIGQLKSDIQLSCAKAYADFLSHKKDEVRINSPDLPQYIREGLYKETEHRQIWNRLIGINNRYFIFNKEESSQYYKTEEDKENIYEIIDYRANELKRKGISNDQLEKIMEKEINEYFKEYLNGLDRRFNKNNLKNIIDPAVMNIADEILKCSEDKLKRPLSQKVYLAMAIHIDASIKRIKMNKKIINPQLQKIRTEHRDEFNIAMECLSIIDREMDVRMPIDEAGFLTMFLLLDEEERTSQTKDVGILVVAHGNSTATSMADVANTLLCTNYAEGINAPLNENPQLVLDKIRKYVKRSIGKSGFLLLADMGSLTTFGDIIEKETNIPIKVVSMVSTIHVLEATRKAMLGYTLDDIYEYVADIANYNNEKDNMEENKFAIITLCMTGEGSALVMKNFLQSHLKLDAGLFEIIPLNVVGKDSVISRIKKINKVRKVICIVSSFKIATDIPQFTIDEVLNLNAIKEIQFIADIENTYIKMGETLKQQLKNVDGKSLFDDIKKCISQIESSIDSNIDRDRIIGIAMHIGCMIDRLIGNEAILPYEGKNEFIAREPRLYKIIKASTIFLNDKYNIKITDDEICYIMELFSI